MTNIEVRKEDGGAGPLATWEPTRRIGNWAGWDPLWEMMPFVPATDFSPAFEIKETKDAYLFSADVPGVKPADLDVTATGHRLTISGKREAGKQERTDSYYTCERTFGAFSRSFTMPEGVDMGSIHADVQDGVLSISLKKLPEAQPKKIEIRSASKKG